MLPLTRASSLSAAVCAIALLAAGPARADDAKAACSRAYDETQSEWHAGKFAAARKSAASCTDVACPDFVRRDCGKWLEQIEAAQPSLVLHARRAGHDVAEVQVDLDGLRWLERLDGRAAPIDPGQHVVRFTSGAVTVERSYLVAEGEKNRLIEVDLVDPIRPGPRPTNGPWIVGGIGVAALVAGGVMTGVLFHLKSVNDDGCKITTCSPDARSAGETGRVLGPVTTATFVAGGLGVAGGAVWLWMTRRTRPPSAVGVSPVFTGGSRGVALTVGF
jgi:hypothetical protein